MTQQEVDSTEVLHTAQSDGSVAEGGDPTLVREARTITPPQQDTPEVFRTSRSIRARRWRSVMERYGGFYWGADFLGFAVAMFFALVFLGIVAAVVGEVGYQLNATVPRSGQGLTSTTQSLGIGAFVGSLMALFIAYFIGGYAAGRMARFSGARQGVGVVIWTVVVGILLGVAGAILGSSFNVGSQLHLNVDAGSLTVAGAISLVIALLVMLIAAVAGGRTGERYHRRIDRQMETMQ